MSTESFIAGYKYLANSIFGKHLSDEYFANAARQINAEKMDAAILRELFSELSIGSPHKTEIHADAIRSMYWIKYKDKNKMNGERNEPLPCKKRMCDGFGMIHALIPKGVKLDGGGLVTGREYDMTYRCSCILGQQYEASGNKKEMITLFTDEKRNKGYSIRKETVYTEEIHAERRREERTDEERQRKLEAETKNMVERKLF